MIYGMFFLGCNFVSGLLCALKPNLKHKTFFQNLGFFSPAT